MNASWLNLALLAMVGIMALLAVLQIQRHVAYQIRIVARRAAEAVAGTEAARHQIELAERHVLEAIDSEREAATERLQSHIALIGRAISSGEAAYERMLTVVQYDRRAAADRYGAILAMIEADRLASADWRRVVLERIDNLQEAVITNQQQLQRRTASLQRDQTREVEALLQLYRDFTPRAPMPSSGGGFALSPVGLLELIFHIDRHKPEFVLELGSGSSSIWIAYAVEKTGGRLITLDHELKYAEQTRHLMSLHKLEKVAEVRLAPLCPLTIERESYNWYDVATLADIDGIDLLLVDGPPGGTGPAARYPALPVLERKLTATAKVVLDDADRPDEQRIVERWTTEVRGLRQESRVFGRLAILSYSRVATGLDSP